jgi:DNA-binding beta-propeller fold protein YncE
VTKAPLGLLTIAALLLACPAPAEDGTLLLANRAGGSVTLFDLRAGLEMARFPVVPAPHEVTVSPDGRWALAGEFGGGSDDSASGRRLVIIDIPGARVAGHIDLGDPSRPHSATFLPDSRRAVATMERAHAVALVDVIDQRVLRTYPIGSDREGHMVALSPDGNRAYVTARSPRHNTGTLSVVFLNEERPPVVIDTGDYSEGLAVSPDGQEVWIANRYGHTVEIIHTESLTIVDTIDTAPHPTRLAFTADGRVAVTSGLAAQQGAGMFTLYDQTTRMPVYQHVLRHFPAPEGGYGGILNVAVADRYAFVNEHDTGRVVRFDLEDLDRDPQVVIERHDHPDGIAWSPLRLSILETH